MQELISGDLLYNIVPIVNTMPYNKNTVKRVDLMLHYDFFFKKDSVISKKSRVIEKRILQNFRKNEKTFILS